jgi:pimeloyl-ACP methyl ester carboxylesterase
MFRGARSAAVAFALLIPGAMVSALAGETTVRVGAIEGTLLVPDGADRPQVALLIAGSGPTDRDGNGPTSKPATLKKLAEQLALQGIASLRYDKRSSRGWSAAFGKLEDFRFTHFVEDAVAFATHLRADDRFSKLILIGHSEGVLVASLAAQRLPVDAVVMLSGTSRRQGDIIKEQFAKRLPPDVLDPIAKAIDRLMAGEIIDPMPPGFNIPLAMQPSFRSAFVEDPLSPLKSLKVPILIAAGARDLQVRRLDFDQLTAAAPSAQRLWLEKMNHVLVDVGDDADNAAAYNQPERALNSELVDALAKFIRG